MAFPSTFGDLQTSVINNLRLDSTADAQKVKDAINQVYAHAVVETDASVTSSPLTLTAGTGTYTLPAGVLRVKGMYVTPSGGTASVPLRRVTLDQIISYRSASAGVNAASGSVAVYALLGLTKLEVHPAPAAADIVTIYHTALPTALSLTGDVPVLQEPYATELLTYGACAKLAEFKKDPDAAYYRGLYGQSVRDFRAHLNRRGGQLTGRFNVQGGPFVVSTHDPSTDTRS